jgi:hypothetical protein
MRSHRALFAARCRLMGSALFALGLASAAATAQAQTEQGAPPSTPEPIAAPTNPNPVAGVTVEAPTRRSGVRAIPPDKAAAFDAEAAKDEAFRKYRQSTPPLAADPNDQSKDFPGLQAYVPK